MPGFGRFLSYRVVRMLIALWSVVTVVFVVMRLSGDPVPLLLPPDAPIAEMERLRHEMGLDQQARSHPAQAIPDGQTSSQASPTSRRPLNPRFVEWLMGFPIGWSEL